LTFGFITSTYGQENVIENLKIVAIKSIQVREEPHDIFLDITTAIRNSNPQQIKLSNGKFVFSIQSIYKKDVLKKEIIYKASEADCDMIVKRKGDIANEKSEVGEAKSPFFRRENCTDVEEIILKPEAEVEEPEKVNYVMFHVNIGPGTSRAFNVLRNLMNCIGNPDVKTAQILINGEFDLGVRSPRGWSSVKSVRINWLFIPEIEKDKVNFMTTAE
jgi:hypothetical protein